MTPTQRKKVAELRIQSMIFDMDIDWETASLAPKQHNDVPVWIKRWKEKENGKDYTDIDNGF